MIAIFRAWERFLFELLVDLMSGYKTAKHHEHFSIPVTRHGSSTAARTALLSSAYSNGIVGLRKTPANYLLLHAPATVIAVANRWLVDSPVEHVFSAHAVDIGRVMKVRHGLVHGTDHAQIEMRAVMLQIQPMTPFQRGGQFLLSTPLGGGQTIFESFVDDLYSWATAMSP